RWALLYLKPNERAMDTAGDGRVTLPPDVPKRVFVA
ncbi:MAG: hypothetical protein QOF74_2709, partial [Caballeronia mineralivorans]|nr:hypothetical protein [Caballeronia mineralivorans]